jgi:hypothetical protein
MLLLQLIIEIDALLGIVQALIIFFKGTESTTVAVPPTVFQ